jgi:tetratricopeptide (TPR) repeat protein
MRNPDLRAVVRTALFFPFIILLAFFSCKNSGTGKPSGPAATEPAIAKDSLSLSMLDTLIRKSPTSPELFAKRAQLLAEKKLYSQALNDITIALSLDSTKPDYYINQAEYYIFNGEPNSAKKGLSACLRKFPNNTDVLLKMAEIHLYLKEYGQSKMVLQQVLPINDDLAQLYFLQGVIALETGDTVGAIRNFQVTIDKEPEYYAAYIQAGKIYANQHDDLAVQYLTSAIDLQPGMYEAHYLLAYFYQEHGFLDEAMQEYDFISTQIDSTLPDPYFNRGYIEMVYRANYTEAAEWFSKAIRWNPGHADSWYNRGFSYELDGKLSQARQDYEKATELQTNYPLAIKGINRIAEGKPLKRK